MSVLKQISMLAAMTALFAVGCAPKSYTPYYKSPSAYDQNNEKRDQFTLQRTVCFGFCPAYTVSVDDRDVLMFQGERFVAEADGAVSKRLAEGSFKKLIAIANAYNFKSYDAAYPSEDGSNCENIATDMPSVLVSFDAKRLKHSVRLYQGCFGMEGREQFDEMIVEIDALLAIDDLIGPREDFYGAKE